MNIKEKLEKLSIESTKGGELYFDYNGLKQAILLCIENRVFILGLEGFKKIDGGIEADFDAIADFSVSNKLNFEELIEDINHFLKTLDRPEEMIWTIVVDC